MGRELIGVFEVLVDCPFRICLHQQLAKIARCQISWHGFLLFRWPWSQSHSNWTLLCSRYAFGPLGSLSCENGRIGWLLEWRRADCRVASEAAGCNGYRSE